MVRYKIWLFAVVVFTSVVWGQACEQEEGVRFGPVIEEILSDSSGETAAIDFDRGTLWEGPEVESAEEFYGWFENTGVDAVGMLSPEVRGLCGFDMVAFPAEQEKWEMSATEVVEAMSYCKVGSPIAISGKGELPATYMIRTREGGVGVLQITGFSDEPNKPSEVKFRYKMVVQETVSKEDSPAALDKIDAGEKITIRIIDSAGRAVSGAKVYRHFRAGDEGRQGGLGVSDEQGKVLLDWDDIYRSGRRGTKALLYGVLGKELAGFVEVRRDDFGKEVGMRLERACRVYGRIESTSLDELNQSLERTYVDVRRGNRWSVLSSSKKGEYEFILPPGKYGLSVGGPSTYTTHHEVKVEPRQMELEMDFDLPAYRLAHLVGKEAPEFRDIKGWLNTGRMEEGLELSELRGKVVLLDFWGYWCGPCVASMPELMELHEKYSERGLVIIAVHDDSLNSVEQLEEKLEKISEERWEGKELEFAVALDGGGDVEIAGTKRKARGATTAAYGIQAWPTMVLIDKDGKVVGEFRESNDEDIKRLEEMLGS